MCLSIMLNFDSCKADKSGFDRSWKNWKVMESKNLIIQAWKVMEFNCRSLKVMEN